MENFGSMEFNHLGKLIRIVLIPFVKYCPQKCWGKWMVELLDRLFDFCEDTLYYAWFIFLHEDQAKVPAYLGNLKGPEEIVLQFGKHLLLKITRSISELLGVLASERLNSGLPPFHSQPNHSAKADVQDLIFVSTTSVIGYGNIQSIMFVLLSLLNPS